MRKKITLTIDESVYEKLQRVPKTVSLSDVATFFFKMFVAECEKGRELTDKEVDDLFNKTPEDQALRLRIRKYVKPKALRAQKVVDKVEGTLKAPFKRKYRRTL